MLKIKTTTITNMKGSLWLTAGLFVIETAQETSKKSKLYGHNKKLQKRVS